MHAKIFISLLLPADPSVWVAARSDNSVPF